MVSLNTTFGNTILLLPDAPTPVAELPVISGVSPDTGTSSSDGVTSTGAVTVSGTAQEGSRVTLFDGAAQVGTTMASSRGVWSIAPDPALSQGAHSLTARATDVAGNLSGASAAFVVTVDRQGLGLLDPLFDRTYYLAQNPDVRAANVDPLLHFDQYGWKEGRDPSLLFSDAKYLAANPDVKAAGIDPLLHYMSFGQSEGRMAFLSGGTAPADPLVDAAFYDKQLGATLIPTGVAAQQQAAWNFDATGWQKGLNPDAFFDTKYYLSRNPDVAAARLNPLLHFEQYGWHEGRDPSAQFSTSKYLATYSDVKAAGIDPLLHYVQYGQAEGRTASSA